MRNISMLVSMLLSLSTTAQASCEDLFFSEYIEGSSYNKSIELYNPNEKLVDLSDYSLELYSNGKSISTAGLNLQGLLSSKETFVISNAKATTAILDKTDLINSSVINFNGDDTLVLKKDGDIIDVIGKIGFDPGSSWSSQGISTKDMTLRRTFTQGCQNIAAHDDFDPSLEWDAFSKDSFSDLGEYLDVIAPEDEMKFAYIHEIQGQLSQSEVVGEQRSVEAVVIGAYSNTGLKGFFLQEEDKDIDENQNTSEGIFIYCPSCEVIPKIGDLVYVEGKVSEYNGMTQISASFVEIRESDLALPQSTFLRLPVENMNAYEKNEAMLVNLNAGDKALIVNDNYNLARYGSFSLGSERSIQYTQMNEPNSVGYKAYQDEMAYKNIIIDDGSSFQNPHFIPFPQGGLSAENTLRAGYSIDSLVGVLDQRYGSYRIQINTLNEIEFTVSTNERKLPEVSTQTPSKGFFFKHFRKDTEVRVASYNVLNYFNTFASCNYGLSGGQANCRGADNVEEFQRQRDKIIEALVLIDADVYGLMEIENDGYDASSALADLVSGLNEKVGKERYAFINVDEKIEKTDALGLDAIKVALIYNKKQVKPVGKPYVLLLDENDKNRPSLLQVFKKRHSHKKLLVSVNHFKSKGSSCKELSYDDVFDLDLHDGQGNCNLTRTYAAKKLLDYIDTNPFLKRNKNVLLVGDFNSYAKEDPIQLIQDRAYTNVVAQEKGLDEYSYIYKGQTGTLDYALVSENLAEKIKSVQVWHSNADEPRALDYNLEYKSDEQQDSLFKPDAYRASDHDPIIIDIQL